MRVGFAGMTHLGQTFAHASEMRGFDVVRFDPCYDMKHMRECAIVFVTRDVETPEDNVSVGGLVGYTMAFSSPVAPIVVMSQVAPGFSRCMRVDNLYYHLDPLIMSCALGHALYPERHVIGCADPTAPLPEAYQRWLDAFHAPILKMSYESAELAKLAVNFTLAAQVATARTLSAIAEKIGADYSDVERALRSDKRIGEHAYMRPGTIGGHLPRDVRRIRELAGKHSVARDFADVVGPLDD